MLHRYQTSGKVPAMEGMLMLSSEHVVYESFRDLTLFFFDPDQSKVTAVSRSFDALVTLLKRKDFASAVTVLPVSCLLARSPIVSMRRASRQQAVSGASARSQADKGGSTTSAWDQSHRYSPPGTSPAGPKSKAAEFLRRHKKIAIPVAIMILLLPLLGLLALLGRHGHAQNYTSPIVYPSPDIYGAGTWSEAYQKAQTMIASMTLEEMNNITLGITDGSNGCVGVSASAPRVGFPGLCLHDAGNGVRDTDGVNAYASALSIGASWNATLAYDRGQFMGAEFKRKGVNVALGPVVGPLGRMATNGRNWEAFASDPYLDGILGAETVVGMQESVIACAKHFIAYEQETNRNPINSIDNIIQSTSANVDDQTMHELYLWPFQDLVFAGVGSVMCSYNRINNTYACENSKVMNGILKGELNFQGFIVSDWAGQHSKIESANAGLDMAMPVTDYWNNDQLSEAVGSGDLNQTRLVDMATRIIATWIQFGQNDSSYPSLGVGMPPDLLVPHNYTDARDPAARSTLLTQAIESHVLVKNINNALPLQKPIVMSIFGYDATSQATQSPSASTLQLFAQSWEGIDLQSSQYSDISSNQPVVDPPGTYQGVLLVGGGSGSNTPAYISAPYDAIQARAYDDGTAIFSDFASNDPDVVGSSDTCLVFINEFASETWDRPNLADPTSDNLVNNVAAKCNNTIVIIHNAGIRLVDAWIDNSNVTAVIFAHLPGQDAGRALAQILYGVISPSGRLPYTIAKQSSDYGSLASPCLANNSTDPQCNFSEGLNIDYRAFLATNTTPRYDFGYGLTYTTFSYGNLVLTVNATATPDSDSSPAPIYANGTTSNAANPAIAVGGLLSLFASAGTITATLTNTGPVPAAEVAQLYIQLPNRATRVLRGFQKALLAPGASTQVAFPLRVKDLSSWDVFRQAWVVPSGDFAVWVGRSVEDGVALQGSFTL
nr:putative beta-glucosidase m [Quercus suber]